MASKATQWKPLENQIYRLLKEQKIVSGKALVAVSGGLDSMLLLQVLRRLSGALHLKIAVVHVHHGGRSAFRSRAQKFVQDHCRKNEIELKVFRSQVALKSEEEARNFRLQALLQAKEELKADWIFLGHHQDDLLETRLLRLLRGTGPQGLRAMRVCYQGRVRPFLKTSKKDLLALANNLQLQWVEDPSNQKTNYLRNWIRQDWLPALESRSPGASKALARSLELLLESHSEEPLMVPQQGIAKASFLLLSESQKKICLARYISGLKIKNLTQNHIKEILRHLDNPKNRHTFVVAQLNWTLTKDMIFAVRRG